MVWCPKVVRPTILFSLHAQMGPTDGTMTLGLGVITNMPTHPPPPPLHYPGLHFYRITVVHSIVDRWAWASSSSPCYLLPLFPLSGTPRISCGTDTTKGSFQEARASGRKCSDERTNERTNVRKSTLCVSQRCPVLRRPRSGMCTYVGERHTAQFSSPKGVSATDIFEQVQK